MMREAIKEVERWASFARMSQDEASGLAARRNRAIRATYSAGNATLAELAKATGLSKQRIHRIVKDGEE